MRAPLLVVVLSPNLARWPGNRDTLRAMREIELKFGVLPARAGAIDAALRRAQARRLAIESRYFDTPDRRLAAAGLVVASATQLRNLGTDAQGARRRPRRAPRGNRSPAGPLGHRGTARRPVAARRHGGGQAAARSPGRRRRRRRPGSSRRTPARSCAAASRSTPTAAGSRWPSTAARSMPLPPWRRCARSSTSSRAATRARSSPSARTAFATHGLWLSTLSKAARGDRLARGETAGPPVKAKPPVLNRGMAGAEIFRAVLRACLDSGAGERDRGRRGPSDRRVDPPAAGRHPPRSHRLARARAARAFGRCRTGRRR